MPDEKLIIGQLEQRILDKEIKEICEGIDEVGKALNRVFAKYHPMSGKFAEELQKFLAERLDLAHNNYTMGRNETFGTAYIHPNWFPNGLKKAILEFATKDFLDRVDQVGLEVEEIQSMLP